MIYIKEQKLTINQIKEILVIKCMGGILSNRKSKNKNHNMHIIKDYSTVKELDEALRKSGVLEDINFLVFVDRTRSNEWTGKKSFGGKCLHELGYKKNPYQQCLSVLDHLLNKDQDKQCGFYNYGSKKAGAISNKLDFCGYFSSTNQLLETYKQTTNNDLYGPTTLTNILKEAIRVVSETKRYHVILVITDGEPDERYIYDDLKAIFEASNYPISIVVVGVGDGPFDYFEGLDDMNLKKMKLHPRTLDRLKNEGYIRRFDNLQFVDLNGDILRGAEMTQDMKEKFYLRGFMEVPEQYECIKKSLGYQPNFDVMHYHTGRASVAPPQYTQVHPHPLATSSPYDI